MQPACGRKRGLGRQAGSLGQARQLLLQARQRGAKGGGAGFFLLDDGGRRFGHEGFVAEPGLRFGDFAFDAGNFLAQPGAFGGCVNFKVP